jgi:hypothetical protein
MGDVVVRAAGAGRAFIDRATRHAEFGMMNSRLTHLGEDLVRRQSLPPVLQYETPEPRPTWRDYAAEIAGWLKDHCWMLSAASGMAIAIAGDLSGSQPIALVCLAVGNVFTLIGMIAWRLRDPSSSSSSWAFWW